VELRGVTETETAGVVVVPFPPPPPQAAIHKVHDTVKHARTERFERFITPPCGQPRRNNAVVPQDTNNQELYPSATQPALEGAVTGVRHAYSRQE
jgi:hypothetical protein